MDEKKEEIVRELENNTNTKKESGFKDALSTLMKYKAAKIALLVIVAVLLVSMITLSIGSKTTHDNKATKLRFEDIGELATQVAYCTEVNVTDSQRNILGINIPFTQTKYIYSYDVIIKAGLDFTKIDYTVNDENKTIVIDLPETKILSTELDQESFKVYHEKESIFQNVSLEENNKAQLDIKQSAQDNAIENGLLESAEENAKVLIENFFAQDYNLTEYKISYLE